MFLKLMSSSVLLVALGVLGFTAHGSGRCSAYALSSRRRADIYGIHDNQDTSDNLHVYGQGTDTEQVYEYDDVSPKANFASEDNKHSDWEHGGRDQGLSDEDNLNEENRETVDVQGLSHAFDRREEEVQSGRDIPYEGRDTKGPDVLAEKDETKGNAGGDGDNTEAEDDVKVELLSTSQRESEDNDVADGNDGVPEDEYSYEGSYDEGGEDDWDADDGDEDEDEDEDEDVYVDSDDDGDEDGDGHEDEEYDDDEFVENDEPSVKVYGQAFLSHAEADSSEWEPSVPDNRDVESFEEPAVHVCGQAVVDKAGEDWESATEGVDEQEVIDVPSEEYILDVVEGQSVVSSRDGEIHDPYLFEIENAKFDRGDKYGHEFEVEEINLVGQAVKHTDEEDEHDENCADLFDQTLAAFEV